MEGTQNIREYVAKKVISHLTEQEDEIKHLKEGIDFCNELDVTIRECFVCRNWLCINFQPQWSTNLYRQCKGEDRYCRAILCYSCWAGFDNDFFDPTFKTKFSWVCDDGKKRKNVKKKLKN